MLESPEIWIPLSVIWAPAIIVGSVWAKRSLVYGFVTILVATPLLYFVWLVAWMGVSFPIMVIGWFFKDFIPINPMGIVSVIGAHGLTLWAWIRYLIGTRETPDTEMWASGMVKPAPKKKNNPFQRKMQ